jgi:PAS domain S-box-containing protein
VIYAPVIRAGQSAGLVAAEFLYRPFFQQITTKRSGLADDYHYTISIGSDRVFTSNDIGEIEDTSVTLDKIYNFPDRRIRIAASPTTSSLQRERRYFPEIALVTGLSFTALLGLSIHLARRARGGQTSAESSNKKLTAEITERSRIEARLKVSDERLRLALDSTQIGIFEWQVTAGQVYYSPGLWALLGYEHSHMPATIETWQALIHPNDLALYRRRAETQLNGVATFIDPEYRVRAQPGDWRWMQMRSKTVSAASDGRPTRIIGTVQDITARRTAEQALRESHVTGETVALVIDKAFVPENERDAGVFYAKFLAQAIGHATAGAADDHVIVTDSIPIQKKRRAVEKALRAVLAETHVRTKIYHHAAKSHLELQCVDYFGWAIWRHLTKGETHDDKIPKAIHSKILRWPDP